MSTHNKKINSSESVNRLSHISLSSPSSIDKSPDKSPDKSQSVKEAIKEAIKEAKPVRCSFPQCNKKLKLYETELICKCSSFFCSIHRNNHNCTFDYKKEWREKLNKDNPPINDKKNYETI